MQTWKIKRRAEVRKGKSRWKARLIGAVLLIATLAAAAYDFPVYWNRGTDLLQTKTGWAAPKLSESPFRLGLDLQGGTHLVYDADMKEIPEADRAVALEGVRDVIERRVNAFGVAEPVVQTTTTGGTYRVIVELAGVLDVNAAIQEIGETPVLEFKEPGQELQREPTKEEEASLKERQDFERKDAENIFTRARAGESFDELVSTFSFDPNKTTTKGVVDGLTESSEFYGPIVKAIKNFRVRPGVIVPKVVETPEGLNIVKYQGTAEGEEALLSHLLICYEGTTGCANPIPELDASLIINRLKNEATQENFAQLAKDNSTDLGSKDAGGDLGWVSRGQMVLPFELEAFKTPVGSISNVVQTDFGYHLILKRDSRKTMTYSVQRILMPLSDIFDIIPGVSPWKNTPLSGKHLKRASVRFDPNSSAPYVSIEFNDEGADLFGELTSRLVGQPIAIFLDGAPISTPTVQSAIYGGQAVITGNFTLDESKLLAQRLNAGALPVPVKLISQQTVGPILGKASLEASVRAALIGFVLVVAFMILVYRLPGVLAALALILFAFLNLAAYKLFGVTLTLSSIAGFVLSIGIAVDANVLIFERFKDEFRSGRDLASAIDEGFKRAWPPIRDGHLTTLISALVLYSFSSSVVRGFALTLAIGVILSLFTAITVTRAYIGNVSVWKWLQRPWMYATNRSQKLEVRN
jgi:protein-export membrane protein SecD